MESINPFAVPVWARVALTVVLAFASQAPPLARAAAPCQPVRVVVDASPPDTVVLAFDGRGYGQVIQVQDTLVSQIRFEMPESLAFAWLRAILYVMAVKPDGTPDVLDFPIESGPVISTPPDPGTDPVPLVFTFDPPLVLPQLGRYYFNVTEENCGGFINLLGNRTNAYGGGGAWATGVSGCDGRAPGPLAPSDSSCDLLCDITYCEALATPVVRKSWGSVKSIYR